MSINLDSININAFLSNVFPSDIFYNHLLKDKIKECEEKNPNHEVRKRPAIFKIIILPLFIAKTIYGIDEIKINKEYMQELDKLILEDFNDISDKNKNENKNNLAVINAKMIEFILKHDDISDEFLNDHTTLHHKLGYDQALTPKLKN